MRRPAAPAPPGPGARVDAGALPVRRGSLGGAWADVRYPDGDEVHLPLALAALHDALAVGAPLWLTGAGGDARRLLEGAGFTRGRRTSGVLRATRLRTLPDIVGPGMRLLICGLNPSVYSADRGVAFARPGNRFWPAALEAGIVSRDRDPWHALRAHGVGFTDLVKRATPRADALTPAEYRAGITRVAWLAGFLRPAVVCLVGLAGWRAAVDPKAVAGSQPGPIGGVPAYLMPNPSGLNAHATVATLAAHLAAAAREAATGSQG